MYLHIMHVAPIDYSNYSFWLYAPVLFPKYTAFFKFVSLDLFFFSNEGLDFVDFTFAKAVVYGIEES